MRKARDALAQAQEDEALLSEVRAAEMRMASLDSWAKSCEECEAAVTRGKEALVAGSRDEAAGHCRAARGLLDGGLKNEALRGAVYDLEQAIKAGMHAHLAQLIHHHQKIKQEHLPKYIHIGLSLGTKQ